MKRTSRRNFLRTSSLAGATVLLGCGARQQSAGVQQSVPSTKWSWQADEQYLLDLERDDFDVVVRGGKGSRVLRQRTRKIPAGVDLSELEERMKKAMSNAKGVGIAGPQVGFNLRVAVLMLDYKSENPQTVFFRNPVIIERSDELIEGYEGCLSVPGVGGRVRRNKWVKIEHTTIDGQVLTAEAEDYNAVLWQHELDHLEGVLYVDRLLGELLPMEEVRRLRQAADENQTAPANSTPDGKAEKLPDNPTGQSRQLIDSIEGAIYLVV
jgi:peptide deformylase